MAVANDSDVVPIERLTSARERFQCEPLRCVMEAGLCMVRRSARNTRQDAPGGKGAPKYPTCAACPDGARVAARVSIDREGDAPPPVRVVRERRRPPQPPTQPQPPREVPVVLRETKSEPTPKNDEQSDARAAECNHPDGCDRPPAGVRKDTKPEQRGWCRFHRQKAHEQSYRARAGKPAPKKAAAPKKQAAPARPKPAAKNPPRAPARRPARVVRIGFDTVLAPVRQALEQAQRAVAVVERLGGIEKAEKIAALVGGA